MEPKQATYSMVNRWKETITWTVVYYIPVLVQDGALSDDCVALTREHLPCFRSSKDEMSNLCFQHERLNMNAGGGIRFHREEDEDAQIVMAVEGIESANDDSANSLFGIV